MKIKVLDADDRIRVLVDDEIFLYEGEKELDIPSEIWVNIIKQKFGIDVDFKKVEDYDWA